MIQKLLFYLFRFAILDNGHFNDDDGGEDNEMWESLLFLSGVLKFILEFQCKN